MWVRYPPVPLNKRTGRESGEDTVPVMRRRGFESLPVLLIFDNSASNQAFMA